MPAARPVPDRGSRQDRTDDERLQAMIRPARGRRQRQAGQRKQDRADARPSLLSRASSQRGTPLLYSRTKQRNEPCIRQLPGSIENYASPPRRPSLVWLRSSWGKRHRLIGRSSGRSFAAGCLYTRLPPATDRAGALFRHASGLPDPCLRGLWAPSRGWLCHRGRIGRPKSRDRAPAACPACMRRGQESPMQTRMRQYCWKSCRRLSSGRPDAP